MSPAVKNVIMLVVLVGVVILAGWFFVKGDPESELSDDMDTSRTDWVCTKCGNHIQLTAADVKDWTESPEKCKKDPDTRMYLFWCDQCTDHTVVRGQWCADDNIWYPRCDLQGNPLNCPAWEKDLEEQG
jgi:hypothetical protein